MEKPELLEKMREKMALFYRPEAAQKIVTTMETYHLINK
jgi:hypothetical protein